MSHNAKKYTLAAAAAFLILMSAEALAQDPVASANMAATAAKVNVQTQNGINFITGGIGDEEKATMDSVKSNYNVHVTSSAQDGAYTGTLPLQIRDSKNTEILSVNAGPLFYVNLPSGNYTLTSQRGGIEMKKNITVSNTKINDVHFVWN